MKKKTKKMNYKRDKENIIRDAVTALAVCHNVTPCYDEEG
jgi:hypothetical protein